MTVVVFLSSLLGFMTLGMPIASPRAASQV